MKRNNWIPDPALFVFALLATMAGLFFIFDSGYARSLSDRHGILPGEFKSQLVFLGIALLGGIACTRIRITNWAKLANWIFFGCLALLLAVPKLGHEMNGA